jgi:hypothetical protein
VPSASGKGCAARCGECLATDVERKQHQPNQLILNAIFHKCLLLILVFKKLKLIPDKACLRSESQKPKIVNGITAGSEHQVSPQILPRTGIEVLRLSQ